MEGETNKKTLESEGHVDFEKLRTLIKEAKENKEVRSRGESESFLAEQELRLVKKVNHAIADLQGSLEEGARRGDESVVLFETPFRMPAINPEHDVRSYSPACGRLIDHLRKQGQGLEIYLNENHEGNIAIGVHLPTEYTLRVPQMPK